MDEDSLPSQGPYRTGIFNSSAMQGDAAFQRVILEGRLKRQNFMNVCAWPVRSVPSGISTGSVSRGASAVPFRHSVNLSGSSMGYEQ